MTSSGGFDFNSADGLFDGSVDLNPNGFSGMVFQRDPTTKSFTTVASADANDIKQALASAGWVQQSSVKPGQCPKCPSAVKSAGLSLVPFALSAALIAVVFYLVNQGGTLTGKVWSDVALWVGSAAVFFGVNTGMQAAV